MGVVIKQSFWGTFIAYLGVVIGYFNALYFRAEYFDLSQIGIFTLITANAMMISPFSSLGSQSCYIKFFPAFEKKDRNKFFSLLFMVAVCANVLILLIGFLLKDFIEARYANTAPQYLEFVLVTAIIIVVNSLFELLFSYSRSKLKVIFPTFLREIFLRAGSLVLAAGYGFNLWNFSTAAFGLGFLYLSALLLILLYLLIFQKLRFTFQVGSILKKWQKKLLDFGIYSMIMAGSFAVMNNISYDQITSIIGSDAMGIFNTCFFIAVIVEMPRRNMAKVVTPLLSTEFEKKNMVEVRQLYQRSSITMATIGSLIVIGIISNLGDLFLFIPKGTSFQTGSWVVVTVCLAKLSLMVSSFPAEVINYSKYYRLNVIFQVSGMLILIVSNTLLIPKIGINGAAISYLICIIAQVISRLLFVYSKFKLSPFNKKHLVLLSIFLLVGALAMLFKLPFHPMLNIAIRAFLTIILFTILVVKLQVSSDINRLIRATFDILQKTIK